MESKELNREPVAQEVRPQDPEADMFAIQEIEIEEISIDGICGVY